MNNEQLHWLDNALTDSLRRVHKDWNLDDFALNRGNTASWSIGNQTYPGYDDPSLAWWYGTFWHPRRVNTALPLIQKILQDFDGESPLEVLDIGGGTAAVAWSFQLAATELANKGGSPPRIEILVTDASAAMLNAGRDMWESMVRNEYSRENNFQPFVFPKFVCSEWDAPSLLEIVNKNFSWIISSYLVVHEDEKRIDRFVSGLHKIMTKTSAKLGMITAIYKKTFLDTIRKKLAEHKSDSRKNIYKFEDLESPSGSGNLQRLHELRKEVWNDFDKPIYQQPTIEDRDYVSGWICKRNSSSGAYQLERELKKSNHYFSIRDIEWGQSQKEVLSSNMPMVIEGGAGTGKTILLAQRIHDEVEKNKQQDSLLPVPENRYLVVVYQSHIATQIANYICELRGETSVVPGRKHYGIGMIKGLDDKHCSLPDCAEIQVITHAKFMEYVLRRLGGVSVPHIFFDNKKLKEIVKGSGSTVLSVMGELEGVIYGSGEVSSVTDYLKIQRKGMKESLKSEAREKMWLLCNAFREYLLNCNMQVDNDQSWLNGKRDGQSNSVDCIMLAMRLRLEQLVNLQYKDSGIPKGHCFSRIFIDEAQDFSRQDIRSVGAFLHDHRNLVLALDPKQSTFPNRCFQVPGLPWRLKRYELSASYRLPLRLTWSIRTLAKKLGEKWAKEELFNENILVSTDDSESNNSPIQKIEDSERNYFRRLGTRLVVLGRETVEEALQALLDLHPILPTAEVGSDKYASIFGIKNVDPIVTKINDPLSTWQKQLGLGSDKQILEARTKGKVKGDEWPVVIWPAWTGLGFMRPHELVYTLLTRSTRMTVVLLANSQVINSGQDKGKLRPTSYNKHKDVLRMCNSILTNADPGSAVSEPILFWDQESKNCFYKLLK